MKFDDAQQVEFIAWDLKQADFPRGANRARIQNLFNGVPPYTDDEVQENQITVNVNSLESTRIGHDSRTQFYNAFLKPGNYFKATTDMGAAHKRPVYNGIVTRAMNRIMKRSLDYFETFRSKFAMDVLHGIGPAIWSNQDCWCPEAIGIEDVFVPSKTLLTMRNLPFFATYRSYTAPELIKLTRGPKVDPGWNMAMVEKCIEYVDQESMRLVGSNWPEVWSPEKTAERTKGDGGFYAMDQAPTIDVFDFKFWDDDGKESGWRRRIILDAWSAPSMGLAANAKLERRSGTLYADRTRQFLYTSGDQPYAEKREHMISFQFADLSAKAPFEYHSVRSLGFLLYGVCHLQNRMRCKFSESVFEALMMYFRVKNADDAERVLKLQLANHGFIDRSVEFVPAAERFQVNSQLVELGLKENRDLMNSNASSYTRQAPSQDKTERTKFEVMAREQQATQLTAAALTQAYFYQGFEYREIFRRFCKANSTDADVREFRATCSRAGVPDKLLNPEAWDIEPERVMGAGNKSLELAIAQQLMEFRNLYDPEPQRQILRDVTLAITDDPARAESLVPDQPMKVTDSVHDAQLASGTLMQGLPVDFKTGMNHIEYVQTLLRALALQIMKINQAGQGMATPDQLIGLQNIAGLTGKHISKIAEDKKEGPRVKQFGDQLGKLMNVVKAFAQRLEEQQKAQAQQNGKGQIDPKDAAKIQATMLTAKAKVDLGAKSHAQKTAQRQLQWEMEQKRKQEEHQIEMQNRLHETRVETTAADLKTASEIANGRIRSMGGDEE